MQMNRRSFLAVAAAAGTAMWRGRAWAEDASPPVCCFSKHLQFIEDYGDLAKTAKKIGLDGLDLTVRAKGHVLPERVAEDLPRAVAALRAEGLTVPMITTNLQNGDDPDADPIMAAAAKEGIRYLRVGGREKYSDEGSILEDLAEQTKAFASLAAIAESHGVVCGYHNHSGRDNVGAPLWDLHTMILDIDSPAFGSNFDIGHATVEGGVGGWHINARLLAPYIKMTAIKDFTWVDGKVRWVPLGQGQVDLVEYFRILKANAFAGPVSVHFEYDTPSDEALIADITEAVATTRAALKEAGFR